MKLEFYDLKKDRLGTSIDHLDFSHSCEEFVAITNKLSVVVFSIKRPGTHNVITQLMQAIDKPISMIKAVGYHCEHVVCYSE